MSFILDALKKAESERNRHLAPVLMDARIAPRRQGLPAWAWALGAGLLLNLGVLGWLLLRTPSLPAPTAATTSTPQDVAPPQAASAPVTPAAVPPPADSAAPQAAAPSGTVATQAASPAAVPALAPVAAAPPHTSGPSLATTGDEEHLPQLQELRNAGVALPELVLNLHAYALAPASRSVLINGQRAREGEFLPNGVKVERITPQAVILEASGRRFRLVAGE